MEQPRELDDKLQRSFKSKSKLAQARKDRRATRRSAEFIFLPEVEEFGEGNDDEVGPLVSSRK